MTVKRNTKLILTGAAILVLIVGCSVAVARAITDDDAHNSNASEEYTTSRILKDVRALMNDTNVVGLPIQAYIIPSVDAHQSEYVSSRDSRIAFVSGFTGSAGTAVITDQIAALWTDSRYFLQAEDQLNKELWTLMKSGSSGVLSHIDWLKANLPPNSRVGIDPFLISARDFQTLLSELQSSGHTAVPVPINIVDLVWKNRPPLRLNTIEPLEFKFSGKRASEKVAAVRKALRDMDAETHIITALDSIAWLLNLRGSDIEHNPVFFSYVILTQTQLQLYMMKEDRITLRIENHFSQESIDVIVKEYNGTLAGINNVIRSTTGKMLLHGVSEAINLAVPVERRLIAESPIVMMKVIKNAVEAQGMRNAHIRDGVAVIKYLHWLEKSVDSTNITELSGAAKLLDFRKEQEYFRGVSFTTISAVGAHAALVHYSPSVQTNVPITRNEIYLVDSGGQYSDGTTDITRTIHLGEPKREEIEAFTRVLKGSILLSTAIFPPKAPFSFFDAMARRYLWDVGMNYGHGTGHGVGAFLNVHEYPPLLNSGSSQHGMLENMFSSNEPGYYEAKEFGIRIENVVQVVPAPETKYTFGGTGALKLFDITMAPIQRKLIDLNMLNRREIDWLNAFHQRIREHVIPLLGDDKDVIDWLNKETEPIQFKRNKANENSDDYNEVEV